MNQWLCDFFHKQLSVIRIILKISFQCICMFNVSETVRSAHICVLFPLPPLKFGPAIERGQGKLVQKMKAHASESGQMHLVICSQVTKKCTFSRLRKHSRNCGNGPKCVRCVQNTRNFSKQSEEKMASQGYTHSCYFLLQRYRSARQSPVQNISAGNGPRWRFRAKQAAARFFLLPMHNMAALFPFFKMAFQVYTYSC